MFILMSLHKSTVGVSSGLTVTYVTYVTDKMSNKLIINQKSFHLFPTATQVLMDALR